MPPHPRRWLCWFWSQICFGLRYWRRWRWWGWGLLTVAIAITLPGVSLPGQASLGVVSPTLLALAGDVPVTMVPPTPLMPGGLPGAVPIAAEVDDLDSAPATDSRLAQGRQYYEQGQLPAAVSILQNALADYQAQGDGVRQAIALSNLALVYGQMGRWDQAQTALADGLSQIQQAEALSAPNRLSLLAQVWLVRGRLELGQSHEEAARSAWQQAEAYYQQAGDEAGVIRSRLRQAQALQAAGFYRRAIDEILDPLGQQVRQQPDSLLKLNTLHTLGETLAVARSLEEATDTLATALAVGDRLLAITKPADRTALADGMAAVHISLGNILRLQNQPDQALSHYAQAARLGESSNQMRSRLNRFSLLVDGQRYNEAQQLWPDLLEAAQPAVSNREVLFNQINLGHSLLTLYQAQPQAAPALETIEALLATARIQAQTQGDYRAESFALGILGQTYLQESALAQAETLTEAGLLQAKEINAADIAYRWQEQLGKIAEAKGDQRAAIAAYQGAVTTLKTLRSDLISINPEVQFSFRESVEPIHRKLVDLLISAYVDNPNHQSATAKTELKEARQVIESLQQAELNDYLQAACLNLAEVQIDQITEAQSTAVVYPIILQERLAVITSFTGADGQEALDLQVQPVSEQEVDQTLRELRRSMLAVYLQRDFRRLSQQVYGWLITPIEATLKDNGIKTLVFVPDGPMRNVPMAALYSGDHYLIEDYAIALTPGLQLLAPQPLRDQSLSSLAFGLSEGVEVTIPGRTRGQAYSPLPNVENELDAIRSHIPKTVILLNDQFTREEFDHALATTDSPIVHIATHGNFSSNLDETYIVAWGGKRISIEDLTKALQQTAKNRDSAVELLVLSACETAAGDDRAALGLAGIAVRAGARSTLASLWKVDDAATSRLMSTFYDELATQTITKAEALRNAQLAILHDTARRTTYPYYWAPFVLVGNWL